MKDNKPREKLSSIRQKICGLRKKQDIYIKKLLRPKPMIVGSLYEVFKTCSKKNCCCKQGNKHGPFFALSISVDAKRSIKMIRKDDLTVIKEKALAYQSFQKGLAKIRKINKEIDILFERIKKEFLEKYK